MDGSCVNEGLLTGDCPLEIAADGDVRTNDPVVVDDLLHTCDVDVVPLIDTVTDGDGDTPLAVPDTSRVADVVADIDTDIAGVTLTVSDGELDTAIVVDRVSDGDTGTQLE